MQNSEQFAADIAVKENQKTANIEAKPEYYLTHNKECAAFRQGVMADADEFNRGYLFGTACICNGAEEHILASIKVEITRYYEKDVYSVVTQQNGSIEKPELIEALNKMISKGDKIDPKIHSAFGKETVVEINVG